MITTLFLDAGGVLIDETAMEASRAEATAEVLARTVPGYSVDDYFEDIDEAVRAFSDRAYHYVFWKRLRPDVGRFNRALATFEARWRPGRPPLALTIGIDEELRRLAPRYRIGIAGQYGGDVLDLLEQHELLDHFAWRFTQADFQITKPDPRYFQQILDACGVEAPECVMVGDRIDKDVIPAKQVGMATVRIRTGLHRRQEPRIPWEIPDVELESVVGLAAAIESLTSRA